MTSHLQDMVDGMFARIQKERAATQMTLGSLIDALEKIPPDAWVDGITRPHSYRGYYHDLAFEHMNQLVAAKDALAICKGAMGEVFEGYKGGEYVMGRNTPLWIANYGSCGERIMEIGSDGEIKTAPEPQSDE